jgi:molybdenum cofactor cytidylyltransferase
VQVVGILLAAGASARFKSDKLLAPYQGQALFRHALGALRSAHRVASIIMVVNPTFPLAEGGGQGPVTVVVNPDHEEGMGSSLRAGIRAAPGEADAYLVALADMPRITAEFIDSLVDFAEKTPKQVIIPLYGGQRGHPVVLKSPLRDALLQVRGDVGARAIVRDHPEMVRLFETDNPAVVFDIDTPEDLGIPG